MDWLGSMLVEVGCSGLNWVFSFIIPPLGVKSASSLFRPRRYALLRAAGFFYARILVFQSGASRGISCTVTLACLLPQLSEEGRMWRLAGNIATWRADPFQVTLDLQHPERGLGSVLFQSQPLPAAALLQMHLAANRNSTAMELTESYVRGSDLITKYTDAEQHICPEFCWRVCPGRNVATRSLMIEVLISTQTDLLDGDPTVGVQSSLRTRTCELFSSPHAPAEQVFTPLQVPLPQPIDCGPAGCMLLFHLAEMPLIFAQLFDSGDVVQSLIVGNSVEKTMTSTVSLFGGRFEKGVIRRARLRGILATGAQAESVLAELWNDMRLSPPPLAT